MAHRTKNLSTWHLRGSQSMSRTWSLLAAPCVPLKGVGRGLVSEEFLESSIFGIFVGLGFWLSWRGNKVVATQTFLEFSPRKLGRWSNWTSMFFKGVGKNHQLAYDFRREGASCGSLDESQMFWAFMHTLAHLRWWPCSCNLPLWVDGGYLLVPGT